MALLIKAVPGIGMSDLQSLPPLKRSIRASWLGRSRLQRQPDREGEQRPQRGERPEPPRIAAAMTVAQRIEPPRRCVPCCSARFPGSFALVRRTLNGHVLSTTSRMTSRVASAARLVRDEHTPPCRGSAPSAARRVATDTHVVALGLGAGDDTARAELAEGEPAVIGDRYAVRLGAGSVRRGNHGERDGAEDVGGETRREVSSLTVGRCSWLQVAGLSVGRHRGGLEIAVVLAHARGRRQEPAARGARRRDPATCRWRDPGRASSRAALSIASSRSSNWPRSTRETL